MPSFEYEPLVLSLEPKTSYEEKDKGNIDGVRPLGTKIIEEESGDLKGRKDSLKREAYIKVATIGANSYYIIFAITTTSTSDIKVIVT